jgi:hypothetical protein
MSDKMLVVNDENYEDYVGRIASLNEALGGFLIEKFSFTRNIFVANRLNKIAKFTDQHLGYAGILNERKNDFETDVIKTKGVN